MTDQKRGDWDLLTEHLKQCKQATIELSDDRIQEITNSTDDRRPYPIKDSSGYSIFKRARTAGYNVRYNPENPQLKIFKKRAVSRKKELLMLLVGFSLGVGIAGASLFVWFEKELKLSPEAQKEIVQKYSVAVEEMKLAASENSQKFWAGMLERNKKQEEELADRLKAAQEQRIEYSKQFAAVLEAVKQDAITESRKTFSGIEGQSNNFIEVIQGKLLAKEKLAEESYKKALTLKSKNPEMAKVLFLNAINHQPDKLNYLQGYVELIKNKESINQEDINQAKSILELSLFQVSGDDIDAVASMLESLNTMQEKLLANANAIDPEAIKQTIEKELLDIKNASSSVYGSEAKQTNISQITSLAERLSELKNNSQSTDKEGKYLMEIDPMLEQFSLTANYVGRCQQIENCLVSAENNINAKSLNAANSQIQEGNSLLAQLWGVDNLKLLPGCPDWAAAYANKIAQLENSFNKAKSADAVAEVEKIGEEEMPYTDSLTKTIKAQESKLERIRSLMQKIYDEASIQQAQNVFKKISEKIADSSIERNKKYQVWAAEKILAAIKNFDDMKMVYESDAMNMFSQNELFTIDQRLLIPEVNTTYSYITQKLFDKMGKEKKRGYEDMCMTGRKKPLEDF